jgi:tRNA threonylcarbamoyladenosine biosynthesis protein TsaB
MRIMLLAIDTATQTMSLALHDGAELLVEETWQTSNNHTVELAPAVRDVLTHAGQPKLTAMAVAIGPGTYTGLRVGVSLAKALASARGLPLIGISTMDILAAAQPQFPGVLIGVVKAGRGRVVTTTYQWRKGHWKPRGEAEILNWDTLLSGIQGAALITGEVDDEGRNAIKQAQEKSAILSLASAANRLRRAGFLAEEAWRRMRENHADYTAAKVTPIYVKTKDTP